MKRKILIENVWYWVTDGVDIWPAMRNPSAAGGWTNNDTWEDFDHCVIDYEVITKPRGLKYENE